MRAPAVLAGAFLAGAVPFSQLAAKRARGVDLRRVGSGTVSGTSLYEVAGFRTLAAAGILEVAKGAVGPLLAGPDRPRLQALAAAAGIAGHNWSPFLGGAGGRGISPALGASLAARRWQGTVLLLSGMVAGKAAKETAVGSLVSYAALIPVLGATGGDDGAMFGAAILVPMLAKRLLGNHPATRPGGYLTRLVFDRDERRPAAASVAA